MSDDVPRCPGCSSPLCPDCARMVLWPGMTFPERIPPLAEMQADADRSIAAARARCDAAEVDRLLDLRAKLPEGRAFILTITEPVS